MIRLYEAGIGILVLLLVLAQFVMLSAGRLGEQWDSTDLDIELKKYLADYQTNQRLDALGKYLKLYNPELLTIPDSEEIGYNLLIDDKVVNGQAPPPDVEIIASEALVQLGSRDAARLLRSLWRRLLRSEYLPLIAEVLDYDSVDELADLILGISWDEDSTDVIEDKINTLKDNQNYDGGWGFIIGEESDALSTSMSLMALSAWLEDSHSDPSVSDGVAWIKARVHADGGYGALERLESSTDITSLVLIAFAGIGLDLSDPFVQAARDFLLGLQRPDGGFPRTRGNPSDLSSTAIAAEALIALNPPASSIQGAVRYLDTTMVDDGNFTLIMDPLGGIGNYDVEVKTGYIVDCSIRGYEFWGEHIDDPIIAIMKVYGTRENMTVELRIERGRLVLPENKQKIALCFSHNRTPDDTDWWILNAGNPHTAGQGDPIDDPKFDQTVIGAYTYLVITNLVVPAEYEFFVPNSDWLIAIVGDVDHTIQDNVGRGYNIGYWNIYMPFFDFSNILVWRSLGSPVANRACLDLDWDAEFDDKRLANGDFVTVEGRDWEVEINWSVRDHDVNFIRFRQEGLDIERYYHPIKYDLSTIPESVSGLYHFGVISVYNKPSFSKDYKVVLRDSVESGVYDEAYIFDGSTWNLYPHGSTWIENGTAYIVGIEGDFLTLARSITYMASGLSGIASRSLVVEGDFLEINMDLHGPDMVSLTLLYEGLKVDDATFAKDFDTVLRVVFGSWGDLAATSRVFHALSIIEPFLSDPTLAHYLADVSQQAIKFNKEFNSVIENMISIQAWRKS